MIWRVISVLAVANLLAIGGVIAWLGATDRLDGARAGELRAFLSETISEQRAREAAEASEAAEAELQAAAEAELDRPPLTFTEQYALKLDQTAIDEQRLDRLGREVADLQRSIEREQTRLASEREAFERERGAFIQTRERLLATEGSAQFRKAVGVLEGLKPAESVALLSELIEGRVGVLDTTDPSATEAETDPELGLEQAVSYLNAMQARVRTKVVNEFTKRDPQLAADLLERLRTRGLTARASGGDLGS